jgi:hypothetical protein
MWKARGKIKHRGLLLGKVKENETTRIEREVLIKWSVRMSVGKKRTC